MDKDAIFLDIDGTLAPNADDGVSEKNIMAIKKARNAGHNIILNTGRSYGWIPDAVLGATDYDGVVSGIGTSVILHGESLYERVLDADVIKKLVSEFSDSDVSILFGGINRVFFKNRIPLWQKKDEYEDITLPEDCSMLCAADKFQKVEFVGELTDRQKHFLEDNFNVFYHTLYIECTAKNCSKAQGMKKVLEKLGISREHCIAVGDSVNDADMLHYAGISVAVANGDERVKKDADYVTAASSDDGVAKAIEHFLF